MNGINNDEVPLQRFQIPSMQFLLSGRFGSQLVDNLSKLQTQQTISVNLLATWKMATPSQTACSFPMLWSI